MQRFELFSSSHDWLIGDRSDGLSDDGSWLVSDLSLSFASETNVAPFSYFVQLFILSRVSMSSMCAERCYMRTMGDDELGAA